MGKTLSELGFVVVLISNCRRSEMRAKLKEMRDQLSGSPGALGFVYYSGHGVQVDGENYLVPVDNDGLNSEADVKEDCLSLGYVLDIAKGTAAKAYVVIIDACRDNPFLGQKGEGGKGLAVVSRKMDPSTLVAFAASPGETASATLGGANSIYTAELARNLRQPNLSLLEVFQSTRSAVRTKSGNKQLPREDNGLEEQIYLNGVASVPAPITPSVPEVKIPSTTIRLELVGVPAGAEVTVDDQPLVGNVYTTETKAKSKQIEVAVDVAGFRPYVRTVVLKRGEVARLEVSLVPNPASRVAPEGRRALSRRLKDYPQLHGYMESLCNIPAGAFHMGSNSGGSDQRPRHTVRLSAFKMGATPVTVAMWREYCVATGTAMPEAPQWGWFEDHPVVNVKWNDIMGGDGGVGFLTWASDVAGFRLTLPTEAQWEYGARGGREDLEFPWGDRFDRSKLWCSVGTLQERTAPVVRSSTFFRNSYGLTDMSGNVWQWCSDQYGAYSGIEQIDPVGPPEGKARCLRGGHWCLRLEDYFRCAYRFRYHPDFSSSTIGFRLAA